MNILGIDFEEWFHPELVKPFVKNTNKEMKVSRGIRKILDWLNENKTYATFFVVGEILEEIPELIDQIKENGHEIGFHTMTHKKLHEIKTKEKFEMELEKFRNIVGKDVKGFRAPTFSLDASTSWAIDCLKEFGYSYDSSIVPVKTKMYGLSKAEKYPYKISSSSLEKHDSKSEIWEFPLMKTKILGKNIPVGGGFYLRTLPTKIVQNSINEYNKKNKPAIMYIHSWELTPEHMPKIDLPIKEKFITYHNIHKALPKMDELIKKFEFTSFERYISRMNN
jgi:polysaccharide deacetylase family protein (PEP-CTERM system associated)